MFDDQTLASVLHDFVHLCTNVICCTPLVLDGEFDATWNLFQAMPHVLLAERGRAVDEGTTVEVDDVEDFDCAMALSRQKR